MKGQARKMRSQKSDSLSHIQFKNYTLLIELCSTILASIEESGLIEFLKKTNKPISQKGDVFCQFYGTHSHSTNKCCKLINQIEVLIRKGKLKRFVDIEAQTYYPKGGGYDHIQE